MDFLFHYWNIAFLAFQCAGRRAGVELFWNVAVEDENSRNPHVYMDPMERKLAKMLIWISARPTLCCIEK